MTTSPRRRLPAGQTRLLALLLALPTLAGPAGCNESWTRSRDTAILALERGDDRTALTESRRLVTSGPTSLRPEAAYLGGIAAYRLGDLTEAMRLLDLAVTARDGDLRGQAMIQRGTVECALGRDREAAVDLQRGGELLGGETGREALLRAAVLYKRLGLEADANRCNDMARRLGGGPAGPTIVIAGYAIQFGAFDSRGNAESLATNIAPAVRRAGLGSVVITEQDRMYKVQVDSCYRDIMSAQRQMNRLRLPAGVMATVVEIGD